MYIFVVYHLYINDHVKLHAEDVTITVRIYVIYLFENFRVIHQYNLAFEYRGKCSILRKY